MTDSRITCSNSAQVPEKSTGGHLKDSLRADLLAHRKALDPAAKATSDELIGRRVIAWCEAHAITSLGVYHPIRREPDLLFVYNALAARGVHLALPVVIGKNVALEFRRWRPGDALERESLGTLAPPATAPVLHPQALLIPCVGYNSAGIRLGYGGGFYDRTLAGPGRPLTLGVCYAFGLVEFAGEAHDMALDLVLTDAV